MRVGGQRHDLPLYSRERDPVPIVQQALWAPGPVWTGAENFALTGIPSPDRPVRSESLYRLRYPGPHPLPVVLNDSAQWKPTLMNNGSVWCIKLLYSAGTTCTGNGIHNVTAEHRSASHQTEPMRERSCCLNSERFSLMCGGFTEKSHFFIYVVVFMIQSLSCSEFVLSNFPNSTWASWIELFLLGSNS